MRWLIVLALTACENSPPIVFAPDRDFAVADMATVEHDSDLADVDFSESDLLEPSPTPSPTDMATRPRDMATTASMPDLADQSPDLAPMCLPHSSSCTGASNCCAPYGCWAVPPIGQGVCCSNLNQKCNDSGDCCPINSAVVGCIGGKCQTV